MAEPILYTDWEKVTWGDSSVVLPCGNSVIALHRDGPTLLWENRVLRFDAAEVHGHVRYGDNGDDHGVRLHLIHDARIVVVLHGFCGQIHDDPIPGEAPEVIAREQRAMATARRIISTLGLP